VIAARDERTDTLEHFAWGVMPELAIRLGRKAGDLERDQAERALLLAGLVTSGETGVEAVRLVIRAHRQRATSGSDRIH
jgi:hypothetical protein